MWYLLERSEVRDGLRAARAFGHVLARHLDMKTAGIGALGLADVEEVLDLAQDRIEGPRLVSARRLYRVAMHGIARPDHRFAFALHRADEIGEMRADLLRAEAADQRQAARFIGRIQDVDELDELGWLDARPALDADRILDAAQEFDMGVVRLARAVADPKEMARCRVVVAARRIDPHEGFLVAEQERFVAGVEVGGAEPLGIVRGDAAGAHEVERLGDAARQFLVAVPGGAVLHEAERPLVHPFEIGIAALRKRPE